MIGAATWVHRIAGVAAACAAPLLWTWATVDGADPFELWLVPAATVLLLFLWSRSLSRRRHTRGVTLAVALLLAIVALAYPRPGPPREGTRVLVVGVDGGSWDLIDPLLEQGRMPELARRMTGAARTDLRSLPSMFSPQVWNTIATGYRPEVHGIWDFAGVQNDLQAGRIWDQLRLEGRSFGLFGWYCTWPPEPGDPEHDFIVPDIMAPDSLAYPPAYSVFWQLWRAESPHGDRRTQFLRMGLTAWRCGLRLSTLRRAVTDVLERKLRGVPRREIVWKGKVLSVLIQADLCAELLRLRRPEFCSVLFVQTDRVSHKFWKFFQPEEFPNVTPEQQARYGDVINICHEAVDEALARLMGVVPEDVNLMIVSDHGFQPSISQVKAAECRIRTENLIAELGLENDVFGTNLDQKVFLRSLGEEPAERERRLSRIGEILAEARLVKEEQPFFEVSRSGEMLVVTVAPRNAVPERAHIMVDGREIYLEELVRLRPSAINSGEHHPDGIFVLAGPAAADAPAADSLHVLDVAPTLAAILDLPVGPDWAGSSLVPRPPAARSDVAAYPLPAKFATDEPVMDEQKRELLRSIGYLE
ncbi:MAG: hypothetical protein GF355_04555 [Candidatus Eisenbacteria bacterium]|nr:hypothetical protein [Candidatus Eisenbacteria bacterium]